MGRKKCIFKASFAEEIQIRKGNLNTLLIDFINPR